MIGAALVFDDLAMFGLPRERGILAPVDAKCMEASEHTRGMLKRRLSLVGALGTPWIFRRIFIFRCTMRGTKHHGHMEVINIGAVAPDQISVPLGFSGLLFSGRRPQHRHRAQPPSAWSTAENKWTSCHHNIMPKQRCYTCVNLVFVLISSLT
jgi:hypothetical protein